MFRIPLLLTLAIVMLAGSLRAQPSPRAVGETAGIGDIVVVAAPPGCDAPLPDARPNVGAVRIIRSGQAPIDVRPEQSQRVLLGDQYRVARGTDVRIRIDSPEFGLGSFTLAPQLLCTVRAADRSFRAYGVVDTASYSITSSAGGALQLGVRSGGAYVQWDDGRGRRLIVVAGGHIAAVPGTAFAVVADSATLTAGFYVVEGRVRLTDARNTLIMAGQFFEVTGAPTIPRITQITNEAALQATGANVRGHLALFTAPPPPSSRWLRTTLLAVGTAAAVTAGYCGFVSDNNCGITKTARRGRLIVEIPL